jgi:hypothetical protein
MFLKHEKSSMRSRESRSRSPKPPSRAKSSSRPSSAIPSKSVSWDDMIVILEFCMVIGANPACSSGAPVELSWKAHSRNKRNMNMYECCRQQDRCSTKKEMVLSRDRRTEILLNAGHTEEEIAKVTFRNKKLRQLRKETLASQGEELLAFALDERANERELSVKAIRERATALAAVKGLIKSVSAATSEGMRKVLSVPGMSLLRPRSGTGLSSGNNLRSGSNHGNSSSSSKRNATFNMDAKGSGYKNTTHNMFLLST